MAQRSPRLSRKLPACNRHGARGNRGGAGEAKRLCTELRTRGFAVLNLPDAMAHETKMRSATATLTRFFALEGAAKREAGSDYRGGARGGWESLKARGWTRICFVFSAIWRI